MVQILVEKGADLGAKDSVCHLHTHILYAHSRYIRRIISKSIQYTMTSGHARAISFKIEPRFKNVVKIGPRF